MAFLLQNWGRASTSANEPMVTLTGGVVVGSPSTYEYYTLDTQAVVATTANYFATVNTDLSVGDRISVYSATDLTTVTYLVTAVVLNPASVTIQSVNGGIVTFVTTLTSAQILAGISGTPIAVTPTPGATQMIIPVNATIETVFNTIAYANGGVVQIQYGNAATAAGTNAFGTTMTAAHFNNGASSVQGFVGAAPAWAVLATYAGLGLFISCTVGEFTAGNGTVNVTVQYRTINL